MEDIELIGIRQFFMKYCDIAVYKKVGTVEAGTNVCNGFACPARKRHGVFLPVADKRAERWRFGIEDTITLAATLKKNAFQLRGTALVITRQGIFTYFALKVAVGHSGCWFFFQLSYFVSDEVLERHTISLHHASAARMKCGRIISCQRPDGLFLTCQRFCYS